MIDDLDPDFLAYMSEHMRMSEEQVRAISEEQVEKGNAEIIDGVVVPTRQGIAVAVGELFAAFAHAVVAPYRIAVADEAPDNGVILPWAAIDDPAGMGLHRLAVPKPTGNPELN